MRTRRNGSALPFPRWRRIPAGAKGDAKRGDQNKAVANNAATDDTVAANVNGLLRTYFLTIAAKNAAKLVDFEHERIAIPLFVFPRNQFDAVRRAHSGTQTARDTLRLEMKYPLYGNELGDETNPLEAGLGWVVKLDKPSFLGKEALLSIKSAGLKRKMVGFEVTGRGIARHGYRLLDKEGADLFFEPYGMIWKEG